MTQTINHLTNNTVSFSILLLGFDHERLPSEARLDMVLFRSEFAPTLPAVVADAQLLPGEVAVAVVGAAAVVPAVRDVAGLAFPVLVAFAVHSAGDGVPGGALPVTGAIIGTRVDP